MSIADRLLVVCPKAICNLAKGNALGRFGINPKRIVHRIRFHTDQEILGIHPET